jgi:membrane-anchored glycerophosphoryl diester phosphodiesterase (GDPDase)
MTLNFVVIGLLTGILILILSTIYIFSIKLSVPPRAIEIIELILILYLSLRCIFCICFIVDDDSSPIESLKQSFEITKDNFFKTAGIFVIIISIMVLALIPVILILNLVGLDQEKNGFVFRLASYCWVILTFPFIQVIIMVTYRKLVYSHLDVDDDLSETN